MIIYKSIRERTRKQEKVFLLREKLFLKLQAGLQKRKHQQETIKIEQIDNDILLAEIVV